MIFRVVGSLVVVGMGFAAAVIALSIQISCNPVLLPDTCTGWDDLWSWIAIAVGIAVTGIGLRLIWRSRPSPEPHGRAMQIT